MEDVIEFIQKQFDFNRNKNLFYSEINSSMNFVPEISAAVKNLETLNDDSVKKIIEYTSEKSFEEFCKINQYYSFSEKDKQELKNIYSQLLTTLKQAAIKDEEQLRNISKEHIAALKKWLLKTNSFSSKMYSDEDEFAKEVVCSEYSAEVQLDLLNIKLSEIVEPVLDIGCGQQARLVNYLRRQGIKAYGIDRFSPKSRFCHQTNWLEFQYEENTWGTIVSHLGFSNHFNHHHLRIEGYFREYAIVYMNILKSLKQGGSFVYTPDLPFIEKYLDSKLYKIEKSESGSNSFKSSKVICL